MPPAIRGQRGLVPPSGVRMPQWLVSGVGLPLGDLMATASMWSPRELRRLAALSPDRGDTRTVRVRSGPRPAKRKSSEGFLGLTGPPGRDLSEKSLLF